MRKDTPRSPLDRGDFGWVVLGERGEIKVRMFGFAGFWSFAVFKKFPFLEGIWVGLEQKDLVKSG